MKHLSSWRSNDVRSLWYYITKLVHFVLIFSLIGRTYGGVSAKRCSPGLESAGWTIPEGDITLEVGRSLEILCIINDDYVNTKGFSSENIVFYNGSTLVDQNFVTRINDTTAKLHIDNVTISASMFYCKLSHNQYNNSFLANTITKYSDDNGQDELVLVCLNEVRVGTKPKDVLNFTCISYNWEFLNVTWIAPNNSVPTDYIVYYQTPKRAGRGTPYKCPNDEDKRYGRCMWSLETDPLYRKTLEYLQFTVNGTNRFGNTSQSYRIHHFAHILPSAPQELKMVNKTVSSIYLSWSVGALHILGKGLIFKIEYTWESPSSWKPMIYSGKDLDIKGDKVGVNIVGLKYPNTPYNFRVHSKSAVAVTDEFWSPPASLVVRTKPCAPYLSPKTDIGSFEIIHETPTYRDVLIYWRALPELEHNGDDFNYSITVTQDDQLVPLKAVLITDSYAKFTYLNFNRYRFHIKSVNAEGVAPVVSFVDLPKKSEIIPEPIVFTKIDYGDGIYELSWKPPDISNKLASYTTFWCESNKDRPYQCNGLVDWIHLPADVTKHNFTINSTNGYQFAISANSNSSSSGMIWASCTALHNKLNKMKNVGVGVIGTDYVDVKWKLECSERIDSIKGYYVYYCPTSETDKSRCTESEKTLKVFGDVTTMHVNITGLKPFTDYKIQVAIFVKGEQIGPRSDDMLNRTLDGPPEVKGIKVEPSRITNNSAHLTWEAPRVTNGILQYYKVQYNDDTVIVNDTQVTLRNLVSYSNYNIKVFACTLFCSEMDPIAINTKIGVPGTVSKLSTEKINSSHVLIKWNPPLIQAGPSPTYDVKVQFDESDLNSTVSEFETTETKAIVGIPNCLNEASRSSYTLYVRAKNIDLAVLNKSQYYVGDWSSAYSINCLQSGMSTLWKVMMCTSLFILILSFAIFWAKKGLYKCQEMKDFDVTLPPKFINPPLFHNDVKQQDYHISIGNWTDDHAESDHLNSKLTDLDQSSIDCIDMDSDRSSSGCYTG